MKVEITVPKMGESISEATVGVFLAKEGAQVKADDEVMELETDKVNQVLYAPQAGRVSWSVKEGDKVSVGQLLGHIDTEVKSAEPPPAPSPEPKPKEEKAVRTPPSPPQKEKAQKIEKQTTAPTPKGAVRYGVDDYLAEIQKIPEAATTPVSKPTSERESRRPLSRLRQVIAERLVAAQHESAMLTTFNEVDMSAVMSLRAQYQESFNKEHGVRLGFMSFFIKASVAALQAYPAVNSYLDGDDVVTRHYFDISVAVGTDRGLVVPVLRGCDHLTFAAIEKQLEEYAARARSGRLTLDELQGGSFTITNGGVYGSLFSTPILNPPQCAILGMHKIEKRAVVVADQVAIRPMMYLALSYDHRLIDGREAVLFLVHIKNHLEDPSRLLLGL